MPSTSSTVESFSYSFLSVEQLDSIWLLHEINLNNMLKTFFSDFPD